MSCIVSLLSDTLPGAASGGAWSFTGFNFSYPSGPFTPGAIEFTLVGDNPEIDFGPYTPGYYQFQYDDACNPAQNVTIWIQDKPKAGTPNDLFFCVNDATVVNLFDAVNFEDSEGMWTVSSGSDPIPPGAFDPIGTLSIPLLEGQPGVYKFIYTVELQDESGFTNFYCADCISVVEVTITVSPGFDAGTDNTILIPQVNGSFNLFDFLLDSPDINGSWVQVLGSTASISGGYLGTVNLDGLSGCQFKFKYSGGLGNCYDESFITVNKDPNFGLVIARSGNQLTANHSACPGATYKWFLNNGTGEVNTGLTTKTITVSSEGEYRVELNCNGCISDARYVYSQSCLNDPCFSFLYNEGTDCVSLVTNGTNTSPVAGDVLQWKKDGGTYATYTGPICGCNLREFLDVVPYCSVNGANLRVGYSSFTSCPGRTISAIDWEFGNGTGGSSAGSLPSYWLQYTPAQWVAFGRSIVFHIKMSTPIGTLIKRVKFVYNGTNQLSCSNITITHENYPKLYYKIYAKRTVTYSDGCPQVICESFFQKDNGCTLAVLLKECNVSGNNSICADYDNCVGTPTFSWKKDGVTLPGETTFYVVKATYGFGVYEVTVTCGACSATDTFVYQSPCAAAVTITLTSGVLTAVPSGCSGTVTYQWYKDGVTIGGATSNTYTPTANGTYSVIISCSGCTATASYPFTLPCSVTVVITQASGNLTATVTGCTGNRTYVWSRWNGSAWVVVQTVTNTSNTNVYTPTISGLYKVDVSCAANGCNATNQFSFTLPCAVTVTIGVTGSGASRTLTANVSGCGANPITYLWERWNGTIWVSHATTQVTIVTVPSPYRVTVSCGGCTAQEFYTFTGCSNSVLITVSGSLLTAVPSGCSGSATYQWAISTNGGTTWTNLGTGVTQTASTTGLYRVTMICDGCTAIDTENFTQPCATTLTLAFNPGTQVITATTSGCVGTETIQWQYSPTGSGWTAIASGVYSIVATASGFYRAITMCNGSCPLAKDIEVSVSNPCDQVTMAISVTAGKLSFQQLKKNGVVVTNYLISWRNPSNVELFKSAAGTYFNAGTTLAHPTNNYPFSGSIKPYILNSDFGNNQDCLAGVIVPNVACNSNYSLNYAGAGGAAANQTILMDVDGSTGFIKVGFTTYTIADTLEVKYNGSTVLNTGPVATGFQLQEFLAPIVYVPGVNTAQVIITNSTPSEQTKYDLLLKCCNPKTSCPVTLNTLTMTATPNPLSCGCSFQPGNTYGSMLAVFNALCLNVSSYSPALAISVGGCISSIFQTDAVCLNVDVAVTKPSGSNGVVIEFGASGNARYLSLKAQLQACLANEWVTIGFKTTICSSDGTIRNAIIFPTHGTLTFLDASRRITYIPNVMNPFSTSCTSCEVIANGAYSTMLSVYDQGIGSPLYANYLAISYNQRMRPAPQAVNSFYSFTEQIVTECGTVIRKYRLTFRNTACPCQSWQLFEDTNLDGTFETLRSEAAGWTGACL